MKSKSKKEDKNLVMLCIYIGLAGSLTILAIYFLTKYVFYREHSLFFIIFVYITLLYIIDMVDISFIDYRL